MVKIVAGLMGSSVGGGSQKLATPDQLRALLNVLTKYSVNELDTARVYNGGKSEELLGAALPVHDSSFAIGTKAPAFSPASLTYQKVVANCNASLSALKRSHIDLYYFHGPDRQTPLEESCRAMQDLHSQGKFTRWGVSNMHVDEVNEIMSICDSRGWVKPTVYQGGYNAIMRPMEPELLPALRKHGIAFYAYSPLAGGYFGKTAAQLLEPAPGGRMEQMKVFQSMYVNELSIKLLQGLNEVCDKENVLVKDAALRWLMHHSPLNDDDGIVLGAASLEQMEENVKACKGGRLPQSIVDYLDYMWKEYRDAGKAPYYSIPK